MQFEKQNSKLKTRIIILFLIGLINLGFGQNRKTRDYASYYSKNIGVGYSYSYGDTTEENYHILDIGFNESFFGGMHGGGLQYGIGSEVILSADKITIGPKISGFFCYTFIVMGAELVTYTDFNNWSLRLVPFFGIGGEKFKLTMNPHVIITNKNFQPMDGLVNLSINLSLKRKKIEKTAPKKV